MPGVHGACRTAWERILKEQLDSRHRPCNFAGLVVRDITKPMDKSTGLLCPDEARERILESLSPLNALETLPLVGVASHPCRPVVSQINVPL